MTVPPIGRITTSTFAQAFTRVRRAGGTRDGAGRFVPGATTTLAASGTISVPRGADLLELPEGRRSEESLRISTMTNLRTANAGSTGWQADLVVYRGRYFEVVRVKDVQFSQHFSALCVLVAHELDGPPP